MKPDENNTLLNYSISNQAKHIYVNENEAMLFFGGPYSNIESLQALKTQAEALSISPTQIVCTGDIFAYCASPQESIELIRNWGVHCIKGNCEQAIIDNDNDCGCGFEEASTCSILSNQWFNYCKQYIKPQENAWLNSLPASLSFHYRNIKALCFHASPSSNNEFIFASSDDHVFFNHCKIIEADLVITGHSGIPFTKAVYSSNTVQNNNNTIAANRIHLSEDNSVTLWHNPGVIGMPANDGECETWYSILSPSEGHYSKEKQTLLPHVNLQHKKLSYDYHSAYKQMIDNNCAYEYAQCLKSGLWPSLDVLLVEEKLGTGNAISETTWTISWPTSD